MEPSNDNINELYLNKIMIKRQQQQKIINLINVAEYPPTTAPATIGILSWKKKRCQNISWNKHKQSAHFVLFFLAINATELLGSYLIYLCKHNFDMQSYNYMYMGTLASEVGISGRDK